MFGRTRTNRASRASRTARANRAAAPASPMAAVRRCIADGVASRAAIARATGLERTTVDAVIDHLERTGALRRERLASSCPSGGCSGCGMAQSAGGTCPSESGAARGPVALVLSRRPAAPGGG